MGVVWMCLWSDLEGTIWWKLVYKL